MSYRALGAAAILVATMFVGAASAREDAAISGIPRVHHDFEAMLMNGDFDQLDAISDDYRKTPARNMWGYGKLTPFYYQLAKFEHGGCACAPNDSSRTFDAKRGQLEAWLAARPQSLSARVALAALWEKYAWISRGGGSGGQTSQAQFDSFAKGLWTAAAILGDTDPNRDPEIYALEMETALVDDDPRGRQDEVYARAAKAFPTDVEIQSIRYQFLQERWFGRSGEAAKYLASLLISPGGDDGAIAYAAVAFNAIGLSDSWRAVEVSGVKYDELVRAYVVKKKALGLTDDDWNALLYYSVAARDKQGARAAIAKLDGRWSARVWNVKSNFDSVVSWSQSWF